MRKHFQIILLLAAFIALPIALWAQSPQPFGADGTGFITLWDTNNASSLIEVDGDPQLVDDHSIHLPVIGSGLRIWYRAAEASSWVEVPGGLHTVARGSAIRIDFTEPGKYFVCVDTVGLRGFCMGTVDSEGHHIYGEASRVTRVVSWGGGQWAMDGLRAAFFGCSALRLLPLKDDPDFPASNPNPKGLRGVLASMFENCFQLASGADAASSWTLKGWDVAQVTDTHSMFSNCRKFTDDLSDWDVGQVTDASSMFKACKDFKSDLSGWNVANVTRADFMFTSCTAFNADLSRWQVGRVTSMEAMFSNCSQFNSDLQDWNVGNVTCMHQMFSGCTAFNADLSRWDVARVTDMRAMFNGCTRFSSDLSQWKVANVTSMRDLFAGCQAFSSDLSGWNVARVTDMQGLFSGCAAFKADLSRWDVAHVTNFAQMFKGCRAFTSDLSGWNVDAAEQMGAMFHNCEAFDSDFSSWRPVNLLRASSMFDGSGLSATHWTELLTAWAKLVDDLAPNVRLSASSCHHLSVAHGALEILKGKGWVISDAGELEGVTVTFRANGGLFANNSAESVTHIAKDSQVVIPPAPTRSGYAFLHWSTTQAEGRAYDFKTAVDDNLILYAQWKASPDNPKPEPDDPSPVGALGEVEVASNPFTSRLRLIHTESVVACTVFNSRGERMARLPATTGANLVLNTSSWPAGLYIIELRTRAGVRVLRAVKQ